MAMMKVKNESGEWVSIHPTNFMHQFKFMQVPKTSDGKGWDLSPYVEKNSDFVVAFVFGAKSATTGVSYFYIKSENRVYRVSNNAKSFTYNPSYNAALSMVLDPSDAASAIKMSYDESTRILKALGDSDSSNKISEATLIYAG